MVVDIVIIQTGKRFSKAPKSVLCNRDPFIQRQDQKEVKGSLLLKTQKDLWHSKHARRASPGDKTQKHAGLKILQLKKRPR